MRVGGATSQLDLPSLTTLSVAGCGRQQLGVPHSGLLQVVENDPTFFGRRLSTAMGGSYGHRRHFFTRSVL